MKPNHETFIGIDPGDARQPYTLAAMDGDRSILVLSQGSIQDVLAYASGKASALVAVSGPLGFNGGLLAQDAVRATLEPVPKPGEWTDARLAEYQLSVRGAPVSRTPTAGRFCPKWIQRAIEVSSCLRQLGFALFTAQDSARQLLEAPAETGYWSLLGTLPFPSASLEGRLQRQLVLHAEKLPVSDPMDFFEEVTRFKLLKGILPVKDIYSAPELNALLAAYTAWLVVHKPERVEHFGVEDEVIIYIPSRQDYK